MPHPTVEYSYNLDPHRGLAAAGVVPGLKLLLALPHLWVAWALFGVVQAVAYIGFWIVAFTGEMPSGISDLQRIAHRWAMRAWAWAAGVTDHYPPFEVEPQHPVTVDLPQPVTPNRWLAALGIVFLKPIAVLPHLVAAIFLTVGAAFAAWFGYFAVLFTGRLPLGIQDFVMGVIQWHIRVWAWVGGLVDTYPPFSLQARGRG